VLLAASALVACDRPTPGIVSDSRRPEVATPVPKDAAPTLAHVKVIEAADDVDALSLVRTRRLEAKAEERVLVVYVGAKWCEPCKRFRHELASGALDGRLGRVTLLAFDADRDGDRLAAAGYRSSFVPFVALPGADGQPAETQQATGKGSDAWRELLEKLDGWNRRR
jgi:hypothetical protein